MGGDSLEHGAWSLTVGKAPSTLAPGTGGTTVGLSHVGKCCVSETLPRCVAGQSLVANTVF